MNHAKAIGRLSILAVGLGIGAAAAATAPTAAAAPTMPVDPVPVVPDLLVPAADPAAGPDLSISFDGFSLFQSGTADAETGMGTGSLAIASGADSFASAGTGEEGTGLFDTAYASGTDSDAESGGGNLDSASANGTDSFAISEDGNVNSAFASGLDSDATAADGNFDSAVASGHDSFANAGGFSDNLSSFDYASAVGTNSDAESGVIGAFSGQTGGDIATVFDPSGTMGSEALAGNGIFDLGAVFSDGLSSTGAVGGNFLVDILP
jgi:hypothetical protein